MKIGILTFHDGINYGAFFQVYAMQKCLRENGFDCRIINYKSIGFTKREYWVFLNPRIPINVIMRHIKKILQFKKAQKSLLLTKRIFQAKKLQKLDFDIIIIGSDEVWNYKSNFIGYDLTYFSEGLKGNKIISYAASFGSISKNEAIPKRLRDCLSRLDNISVRDENSFKIMNNLFNDKPIQIVLDPTFMTNLSEKAILPMEKDYILVYGFFTKEMVKNILDYARVNGKKTISISYNNKWCDKNLDTLNPFQWLGYFVNCCCVITTMYHGMVLSLQNKKEFCMYKTEYRQHKVGNLLNELGVSERFIDENMSLRNIFEKKIDYLTVNQHIETKRKISAEFLLTSLKI